MFPFFTVRNDGSFEETPELPKRYCLYNITSHIYIHNIASKCFSFALEEPRMNRRFIRKKWSIDEILMERFSPTKTF
jgi:hypothetical protein